MCPTTLPSDVLVGGLSIMAGFEVSGLLQWGGFFSPGVFKLIVPGILCGIMIYLLVRQLKSAAVLPACIVGMMLIFYTVLLTTGTSLDDARDGGWLSQAEPAPVWYQTWAYLKFNRVVWSALPPQIPTLIGMIFVVALSSSLDVAAIELELKKPLNYNHELKTVGISRILSCTERSHRYSLAREFFILCPPLLLRVVARDDFC
mmetsp:Transcript_1553/g.2962  ORF Transcript_1553/g.2962 Transcript_1553/m.2962 type:complete len:203 (+) Transcript_1553:1866-2474(+)